MSARSEVPAACSRGCLAAVREKCEGGGIGGGKKGKGSNCCELVRLGTPWNMKGKC